MAITSKLMKKKGEGETLRSVKSCREWWPNFQKWSKMNPYTYSLQTYCKLNLLETCLLNNLPKCSCYGYKHNLKTKDNDIPLNIFKCMYIYIYICLLHNLYVIMLYKFESDSQSLFIKTKVQSLFIFEGHTYIEVIWENFIY